MHIWMKMVPRTRPRSLAWPSANVPTHQLERSLDWTSSGFLRRWAGSSPSSICPESGACLECSCTSWRSSSSTVPPGLDPDPRSLVPPRTKDRRRCSDNAVCRSCSSWGSARTLLDVGRRNIRWGQDRSWRGPLSGETASSLESSSGPSDRPRVGHRRRSERFVCRSPSPSGSPLLLFFLLLLLVLLTLSFLLRRFLLLLLLFSVSFSFSSLQQNWSIFKVEA